MFLKSDDFKAALAKINIRKIFYLKVGKKNLISH